MAVTRLGIGTRQGWAAALLTALLLTLSGCKLDTSCGGDCGDLMYTSCTCGASDPCNWAYDGVCDSYYCSQLTSVYFDDSADCGGASATCDMSCGLGQYTSCTCDSSDPCNWIGDGYCDDICSDILPVPFDDSLDCGGGGDPCGGDCAGGRPTACTCGGGDPCMWAYNGVCEASACQGQVGGAAFDDSADCGGGGGGGNTFGVTAVRDDLDNADLDIMAQGLQGLGYDMQVRDTNVSSGTLASYFGQNLTTLYHTGHGFEQGIATSDGVLALGDINLGVQNAIIATCLALYYSWESAFGGNTESVLGYTKVSFDFIDDQVVRLFLQGLGSGSSYLQAWYMANVGIGELSDRWAAYVREGGIAEYSARSGRSPSASAEHGRLATLVPAGRTGRLWVSESLLVDTEVFAAPTPVLISREGAANPLEQGFVNGGWSALAPSRMTRDRAEELARGYAARRLGSFPDDAELERISPIISRTAGSDEVVIGYTVRFARRVEGLPVRGNGVTDHLAMLVGPGGVLAWSRSWPEINSEVGLATPTFLTVGEALSLAADEISRAAKGEVVLLSARTVWGAPGFTDSLGDLVPAYELEGADGTTVVIDALTGRVVR